MELAVSSNSTFLNKVIENAISGAISKAIGIPAVRVNIRSASVKTSVDGAYVTVDINGSIAAPTMSAVAALTNKSAK
jgi:hypothetical protein